ncbi:hypothetical protein BPOR_0425g00010 [Botrytis porri]|uniref:Uncharacterized protein n=1 Tax=Botrytis porri TaxID=87229 RepID=A0A4Z1KNE1_9HELO|nr:hypothetical protein BPOR_0425g00010 [Botrytis porri]
MSNKILLMTDVEEKPYCIWHPHLATVDTYQWEEARSHYLNITEDHGVSETSSAQAHGHPLAPEHVSLLYSPLPIHLPTTNKDALILHAAYEGNIDRYARLRRPVMMKGETEAIVRGTYHNTSFARWCHGQLGSGFVNKGDCWDIKRAILARFIMVNDLSRVASTTETLDMDQSMLFMIWWPLIPHEATLPAQQEENGANLNKNFYVEDLERRAAEKGIDLRWPAWDCSSLYDCLTRDKEPTTIYLQPHIQIWEEVPIDCNTGSIHPGRAQANMAEWDLCIAVSDDLREQARTENVSDNLNENWGWPYSCWEAQVSHNWV